MKKNILILIVLVLVLAGGYYYWKNTGGGSMIAPEDTARIMMKEYNTSDANEIALGIMGRWKSLDDAKFEEEFVVDALYTYYDGADVSKDTYQFFNTVDVPGEAVQNLVNNSVYLKVANKDAGDLWYRITKLNGTELEMFYEGKGNLLKFSRVIPPNY
jgi:hypothetical protein